MTAWFFYPQNIPSCCCGCQMFHQISISLPSPLTVTILLPHVPRVGAMGNQRAPRDGVVSDSRYVTTGCCLHVLLVSTGTLCVTSASTNLRPHYIVSRAIFDSHHSTCVLCNETSSNTSLSPFPHPFHVPTLTLFPSYLHQPANCIWSAVRRSRDALKRTSSS